MMAFENIVGKGENAGNQHFLLFQQCFLPFPNQISIFESRFFCRLQMLSIWTSLKICCLVKGKTKPNGDVSEDLQRINLFSVYQNLCNLAAVKGKQLAQIQENISNATHPLPLALAPQAFLQLNNRLSYNQTWQ